MPSFIHEKLNRARAQLESARRNLGEGDTETACNRAFLAAENAASAAIAEDGGRVPPVHSQIRSQFEELCDRGTIPYRFRDILIRLYRFRLRGDYGRRFHIGQRTPELKPETVRNMLEEVSDLVASVEEITKKHKSHWT